MDDKKQALINAIEDKYNKFTQVKATFGPDHFLTTMYFREMVGLKEAFEIVFGVSYIDFFIGNMEEVAKND